MVMGMGMGMGMGMVMVVVMVALLLPLVLSLHLLQLFLQPFLLTMVHNDDLILDITLREFIEHFNGDFHATFSSSRSVTNELNRVFVNVIPHQIEVQKSRCLTDHLGKLRSTIIANTVVNNCMSISIETALPSLPSIPTPTAISISITITISISIPARYVLIVVE